MLSIESVNVMTILNSIVKIDARDANGINHCRFFDATTDAETLNGYIAEMQNIDAATPSAPKTRKTRTPAATEAPVVAASAPAVQEAPVAAPLYTQATVGFSPVAAPVVQAAPTPVVAAPVVQAAPTPVVAAPAPVAAGIKMLGTGPGADPEPKAVVQRWTVEALGSQDIPKHLYGAITNLTKQLREGSYAILVNGEENLQIKEWYVNSIRTVAAQPVMPAL